MPLSILDRSWAASPIGWLGGRIRIGLPHSDLSALVPPTKPPESKRCLAVPDLCKHASPSAIMRPALYWAPACTRPLPAIPPCEGRDLPGIQAVPDRGPATCTGPFTPRLTFGSAAAMIHPSCLVIATAVSVPSLASVVRGAEAGDGRPSPTCLPGFRESVSSVSGPGLPAPVDSVTLGNSPNWNREIEEYRSPSGAAPSFKNPPFSLRGAIPTQACWPGPLPKWDFADA